MFSGFEYLKECEESMFSGFEKSSKVGPNFGHKHFTPSVFDTLSKNLTVFERSLALGFKASCICHLDRIVRTIDGGCCGLDPTEVVHSELQW